MNSLSMYELSDAEIVLIVASETVDPALHFERDRRQRVLKLICRRRPNMPDDLPDRRLPEQWPQWRQGLIVDDEQALPSVVDTDHGDIFGPSAAPPIMSA